MVRIRELRKRKGVSQARLAITAGMDPATLNRLEQGKGNPNIKTMEKIAEALSISVSELLEGEAPKAQAPPSLDSGERGHYPYPWMGDALARLIDGWEQSLEEVEVNGRYAHALAIAAMDALGAVLLMGEPGDTMRERAPENEVGERNRVADRLFKLSGMAIDRYRASDVFESDEEHRMTEQRGRLRLVS